MGFDFFAGDLSLDFINTLAPGPEPDLMLDSLTSYHDLIDWAAQAKLLSASERTRRLRQGKEDPQAAKALLRQAIQLRDSLHRLVLALLEDQRPAVEDLRRFNQFLGEAQAHVLLHAAAGGYRLELSEDGQASSFLWPIAHAAGRLLASPDAKLIRRCAAETCLGFFVDRSKNHSRRWCDMKVCGNREKARQYYAQQRRDR